MVAGFQGLRGSCSCVVRLMHAGAVCGHMLRGAALAAAGTTVVCASRWSTHACKSAAMRVCVAGWAWCSGVGVC